jgi:ATP-binding cassette subfamily B protein
LLPFRSPSLRMIDMNQHSWLHNLFYCLHDAWLYKRSSIVFLVIDILATLGEAVMGSLTSYYVVLALTNSQSSGDYLSLIAILCSVTFVLTALKIIGSQKFEWNSTFSRCTISWNRLTAKTITTDYLNIEPREARQAFEKAWEALDSNWVGLEAMDKQAPQLFIGAIGMIVYAIIVAFYVPWVLLVMAGMVIVSFLFSAWGYSYMKKKRGEEERLYHKSYVMKNDATTLENSKDIRSYRLDRWFDSVYAILCKDLFNLKWKIQAHFFLGEVSNNLFLFARDAIAYSLLIPQVINGSISLASFTFLVGIIAGFSTWVNDFTTACNKARFESIKVEDYRKALATPDSFNHGKGVDIKSLQKPFEIVFDHVGFHYPGDDKEILHDVCLRIRPGEKIALVGNNGAGKTTLVKLLCGLYQPTQGRILLNGIDVKEFNINDYMSLISALFQDVEPLAFTLKTNVTCCPDADVDEARFEKAIADADLSEKVASLPQKENTFITQMFDLSGVQLSGGENQKLLLARALYKNAPLLVLDEPTAALDPLSEEKMYKHYVSFAEGNTSIFISHRLASTRFCDRIVFLEGGRIEEIGTHEELLKGNRKYKEMFLLQAKYYKEGGENDGTH